MAFEHGHRDKVQVDQLTEIAYTYAHVEKRLATMRASITNQRHGPNLLIVEDADDLLQRDNDQDVHVLTDDAIIETNKFRHLRAILGFLDGCCRLSEQHANADIVHGQVDA
jgi:hypothetical protein